MFARNIKRIFVLFSLIIFSLNVYASNAQQLLDYVSIIRNDQGQMTEMKINKKSKKAFIELYQSYTGTLIELKAQNKLNFAAFSKMMDPMNVANWSYRDKKRMKTALKQLNKIDIAQITQEPQFQKVMLEFNTKLNESLLAEDVVARPLEYKFYRDHNMAQDLVRWAADLVGSVLIGPGATLALYLFNKALDQFEQRRAFYQNMVLHYLEFYPSSDLGLTQSEAALIRSSIYEATLKWWEFWDKKATVDNWADFGNEEFFSDSEKSEKRLFDHQDSYSKIGPRINFAFFRVQRDAGEVLVNSRDGQSFFSGRPSMAFDAANPNQIMQMRWGLELLGLGIEFAPVPGLVQSAFQHLLEKMYVDQVATEGALFANFLGDGDVEAQHIVVKQSVNLILNADFSY